MRGLKSRFTMLPKLRINTVSFIKPLVNSPTREKPGQMTEYTIIRAKRSEDRNPEVKRGPGIAIPPRKVSLGDPTYLRTQNYANHKYTPD